ncbi:MAG TPA: oligosaccharide flippase family protein [Pyrinomonadaceae bacterium]|jgi:O-antigen/teichoic acid export membrane protein
MIIDDTAALLGSEANTSPRQLQPRRLLMGIFASYTQIVLSLMVGFVSTPLYLKFLGQENYGLWITMSSITAYLSLSTVGFSTTSLVRMSQAYAQDDRRQVGRLLTTSAVLWFGVAALACCLLILLVAMGAIRPELFGASNATGRWVLPVLMVLALGFLLSQPLDVFRLAVRAFQRVDLEQAYIALNKLLLFGAAVTVIALGGGVLGLAVTTVGCQLTLGVVLVVAIARFYPNVPLSFNQFDIGTARKLIVPSFYFFAISMAGSLIWGTDNLVISTNMGLSAVAPFAVAMQLSTMGTGLLAATINATMPRVSALDSLNEHEKLKILLKQVVKLEFALVSLLGIGFFSFGVGFLRLWVGPQNVAPRSVLGVLLLVFLVRSFAMPFEMVLVGTLKHRVYAGVVIAEGLLNLFLSLFLVRRMGLLGVALGTLVSHLLCTGWFLPTKGLSLVGLHLRDVFWTSLMPITPAILVGLTTAQVLKIGISIDGWIMLVLSSMITAVVFLTLLWIVGLRPEERLMFQLFGLGLLRVHTRE